MDEIMQGIGETAELNRVKDSSRRGNLTAEGPTQFEKTVRKFCRIYFPTRETVENSLGGLEVSTGPNFVTFTLFYFPISYSLTLPIPLFVWW